MKEKILLLTGFNYDKEYAAKLIDGKDLSLEEATLVMNDNSKYQKTLEFVRILKSDLIN
jgi:hypothetical protein